MDRGPPPSRGPRRTRGRRPGALAAAYASAAGGFGGGGGGACGGGGPPRSLGSGGGGSSCGGGGGACGGSGAAAALGAALWEAAQGYERLLNEETLRELTPSQLSTLHGAHMRMLDELQAAEWRTFQKVEQESKRRRIAEALRKEKEWD